MGPLDKLGEGHVHTAIFGGASLQSPDRIESNAAALKAEVEGLSRCAQNNGGMGANERIVGSLRPRGYRPPAAIQLLCLLEVRSSNDHRTSIRSAGNGVGKGNRYASAAQSRADGGQRIVGEALAVPGDHDDIGAVLAKLASQLGLNIHIKVEHRRGHGGRHDHSQQSRGCPPTAQDRGAPQHAQEHRSVGRGGAAPGDAAGLRRAQASPRRAYTGSNFTARRIATALPAKVTSTAIARMMGRSTGWMVICEAKMECPIWRASSAPPAKPAAPASKANSVASAKNSTATARLPAPSAFIKPTSPRRSTTAVAIEAETASAEASSAASVIRSISPWMRESTVPSFWATWRICSACECGMASCSWNAMDCA